MKKNKNNPSNLIRKKLEEMKTKGNGIFNPTRLATQGKCSYEEYKKYLMLLSEDEIITLKADLTAKVAKFGKMVIPLIITFVVSTAGLMNQIWSSLLNVQTLNEIDKESILNIYVALIFIFIILLFLLLNAIFNYNRNNERKIVFIEEYIKKRD